MISLKPECTLLIFSLTTVGCGATESILRHEDECHIELPIDTALPSCGGATIKEVSEKNYSMLFEIGKNIGVSLGANLEKTSIDVSEYYGEVSVCVSDVGQLYSVKLKHPSHSNELNDSYMKAVAAIKPIEMPSNECLVDLITSAPIVFEFTDKE